MTSLRRPLASVLIAFACGFALAAALFSVLTVRDEAPRAERPATAAQAPPEVRENAPSIRFMPVQFAVLPGWGAQDPRRALQAFLKSCTRLERRLGGEAMTRAGAAPEARAFYGDVADWTAACESVRAARPDWSRGAAAAREAIAARFEAYAVEAGEDADDRRFTAYYEPVLDASPVRTQDYRWPILAPPRDLVSVDVRRFDDSLPAATLRGRVGADGRLDPYPTRAAIEADWPETSRGRPIAWLADRTDLFFLHVQGSGRLRFPDGAEMRVGYAADNGRDYRSIGRALVAQGVMEVHEVSQAGVREWVASLSRAEADAFFAINPSFIFFEKRELPDPAVGPLGAMGVSLSPRASLAVDPAWHAYGALGWFALDAPPSGSDLASGPAVFQDTGSAIRGRARVDIFIGSGDAAGALAGRVNTPGRLWVLRPKQAVEEAP